MTFARKLVILSTFPSSFQQGVRAMKERDKTKRPSSPPQQDPGLPGGGKGRKDIVGKMPPNIRVDPNITEGHPGYEESGESELTPLPLEPPTGGKKP
jgi:hypothetical protein